MGRAPCCEKVGLKRGRWTREEDEILANYIKEHGEGSWRSLPKNAGLLRCGKSCRLRWINYLRADLKRGNISEEEEEMIVRLHATLGNRWSLIAGHLPGRTDNEIKNYWNSHLNKRAQDLGKGGHGAVVNVDLTKLPSSGKRRGGRACRATVAAAAVKWKGRGKGKDKMARKDKDKVTEVRHHHKEEEEEGGEGVSHIISTPSSCQPCTTLHGEEQAQASASGVTSDGLDEGPLGLCEEMVSGLPGPESPKMEKRTDGSSEEGESGLAKDFGQEELSDKDTQRDHHGSCIEGGSGPCGPAEHVGQEELGDMAMEWDHHRSCNDDDSAPSGPAEAVGHEELGDKAMGWDLAGLDDSLANDDMWGSLVWDYDEMVIPDGGQQQELVMSDLFFLDNI